MDAIPLHPALVAIEITLLAAGVALLGRGLLVPERRRKWLETNRLPPWNITGSEVTILVVLMFVDGLFLQAVTQHFLGPRLADDPASPGPPLNGRQVFAYGLSFQLGVLLGWYLFQRLRRTWQPEIGAPEPPAVEPAYRLSLGKVAVAAATAVLVALPLLALTALLWGVLLEVLGLPREPQDLIGIFARTDSPWVFAGLLVVACVMAPISEELIFRRTLYRYLRQRFGRAPALLASAVFFGTLHANWASFAPLCVLGVVFALAYEKTGDLRVAITAHGLFNLLNAAFIMATGGVR